MPLWQLEKARPAGEIIKLHGYLGAVRVAFLFPGLDRKIKPDSYLFIEWMEKPVPYLVETIQWTSDDSAIVKLADVNSEAEAKKLVGRTVILHEASLPKKKASKEDGGLLIGFMVLSEAGQILGEVIDMYDAGPQKLLEIKQDVGTFLVPYHPDLILKEDRRKKQLIVRLPEGLTNLSTDNR